MNLRDFRRAGHFPSLVCAFLYFDVSFMIWVLLGPLANRIAAQLVPQAEGEELADYLVRVAPYKGLMVAVPLLAGAFLRVPLGIMTDRWGAKRTGIIGMVVTAVPLLLGWLWLDSYREALVVGALLGVAGASFAAALPLASRWYPPRYQGLAMGIAGAGNSGTAVATFFGPRLAEIWGWHAVFAAALVPVLLTLAVFTLFAKDSPNRPEPKSMSSYTAVLWQRDTWWFCLFYSVTFGGFVGLASFLNIFFHVQYDLSRIGAGNFATVCVIAGSFLRPVGGYLADTIGGTRLLTAIYLGIGVLLAGLSFFPPLAPAPAPLFFALGLFGLGHRAVFQLVPQRFPKEIGVITGIVGAAGGVGGFFLPALLGGLKQLTGSFAGGFAIFALIGIGCAAALLYVSRAWEGVFIGRGGVAS